MVTAFSPASTLKHLLPRGVLAPKLQNRVDHIPTKGRGISAYQQTLAASRACARGDVPEHVPGLALAPTAFDPSMAPEGCDTFWFWSGTPSHPR